MFVLENILGESYKLSIRINSDVTLVELETHLRK
jgi:hypothetical protein